LIGFDFGPVTTNISDYGGGGVVNPTKRLQRMGLTGYVARMGEKGNAYRILVGKAEDKRPLGRPRRRWVDSIKMDLRERERMGSYVLN
jgi:hypothetical protein